MSSSTDSAATTLSWLAFSLGYLAAYFLSTVLPTPLLWYYPLKHGFRLQVHPSGLAADFYGRVLLCLAAGGLCLTLCRMLLRRFPRWVNPQVGQGLLIWVASLLVFTCGLYVSLLVHRVPMPMPLPAGYVPR